MSGALLLAGTLLTFVLEYNNSFKELGFIDSAVNSFFVSACSRSAGFQVINFADVSHALLFALIFFMVIGASPSSTGSGIKTTTFALFVATVNSIIRNRDSVEIYGRTIHNSQVYKTMAIIAVALSWIGLSTFILLLVEKDHTMLQLLFECASAFATCGFSTGITGSLSLVSKGVLVASMIIGRIGSLTLVLALRKKKEQSLYQYPKERIIIG